MKERRTLRKTETLAGQLLLAHPVLRHRVIPNFYAESERISADNLVDRLLEAVPPPRSGM